jgi:hypothetical protein
MAWIIASSGEAYDGDTHVIAGTTYSGKTRTPSSQRLLFVDKPAPKPAPKSVVKKPAAKK